MRIIWKLKRLGRRLKPIVAALALYLSITGIAGFSCFILEESIQTVMFGTWAAADAKNWPHVALGCRLASVFRTQIVWINNSVGWLNPFGWVGYNSYAKASLYWVQATRLKILANDPGALIGEEVEFRFSPATTTLAANGGYIMTNGPVTVLTPFLPTSFPCTVTGTIQRIGTSTWIIQKQSVQDERRVQDDQLGPADPP